MQRRVPRRAVRRDVRRGPFRPQLQPDVRLPEGQHVRLRPRHRRLPVQGQLSRYTCPLPVARSRPVPGKELAFPLPSTCFGLVGKPINPPSSPCHLVWCSMRVPYPVAVPLVSVVDSERKDDSSLVLYRQAANQRVALAVSNGELSAKKKASG